MQAQNSNDFYIEILNREFESRARRNSKYSLRAYSRDIGLSAATLSQVLAKKKGLSEKNAIQLTQKLGLNRVETEMFILSVNANYARNRAKKSDARLELKVRSNAGNQVELLAQNISDQLRWQHLALFSLLELPECNHKCAWFAKRLGLPLAVVQKALDDLCSFGWLIQKDGRYVAKMPLIQGQSKKYVESVMDFSKDVLWHSKESTFANVGIAFKESEYAEAKADIKKFLAQFIEKYQIEKKTKDSVYQMSLQFFRMDKPEEKSKI